MIFICNYVTIFAQDPVFSQFYIAPLQLNPAFAGNSANPQLAVNYRLQWPGLSAFYNTFSLGYDQFFENSNLSLGVTILNDAAGDGALKTTKASGIIGYKIRLINETYIKGGVEVAFTQKRLNWQKLLFYDAIQANGGITPGGSILPSKEIEPSNTSRGFLDIGSGLLLFNEKYFFGIALDHMNTPVDDFLQNLEQNYVGLPIRYSVHAGYQFLLFDKHSQNDLPSYVSPNLLYTRQADFSQLNLGAYVAIHQVFGGLWYRRAGANNDAIIASVGFRTRDVKIGYSFDYTISGITIKEGGSHELGLLYSFNRKSSKKSKLNDCLNLFR